MLTVAMDANFRLRSKIRGTGALDITLNPGWAYFVDNKPYADFIKDYVDAVDVCLPSFTIERYVLMNGVSGRVMCGLPGPSQHAYQKIKGASCNWHGSGQLCTAPILPAIGCRRLTEGGTVRSYRF